MFKSSWNNFFLICLVSCRLFFTGWSNVLQPKWIKMSQKRQLRLVSWLHFFFCFVSDVSLMYVLFFCRCYFQILKIFLQFTKTSCPLWRIVYSQNLMHSMKSEPAFWIMYAIFYFRLFFMSFFYFLPLLITVMMINVPSHED